MKPDIWCWNQIVCFEPGNPCCNCRSLPLL